MINFIKKIWEGPISVKLSLIFILFVIGCLALITPGQVLFVCLVFGSVMNIVVWLDKDEDE
jgi:hypothetical protein